MWISPSFMLKVIRTFDQMVMNRQPANSIDQNATLLQNANRAAERAYQLELERQRELLELEMVAQQHPDRPKQARDSPAIPRQAKRPYQPYLRYAHHDEIAVILNRFDGYKKG